jgi:hypothetical protein
LTTDASTTAAPSANMAVSDSADQALGDLQKLTNLLTQMEELSRAAEATAAVSN